MSLVGPGTRDRSFDARSSGQGGYAPAAAAPARSFSQSRVRITSTGGRHVKKAPHLQGLLDERSDGYWSPSGSAARALDSAQRRRGREAAHLGLRWPEGPAIPLGTPRLIAVRQRKSRLPELLEEAVPTLER
jgi:hypothetical protein